MLNGQIFVYVNVIQNGHLEQEPDRFSAIVAG